MTDWNKVKRFTYTIDETAKLLHVPQWQVWEWINKKEMRSFMMGKSRRIPGSEVEKRLYNSEKKRLPQ